MRKALLLLIPVRKRAVRGQLFPILILCLTLAASPAPAEPLVTGATVELYAEVDTPGGLTIDPTGVLYVGNQNFPSSADASIHRVGIGGSPVEDYGPPRSDPDAVLFDATGAISGTPGAVLVGGVPCWGCRQGLITAVLPDESSVNVFGPTSEFMNTVDMEFDSTGRLIFTETLPAGSVMVSTGGFPTALFSGTFWSGLAIDADDNIYTTDQGGTRVQIRDYSGGLVEEELAVYSSPLVELEFPRDPHTWGSDLFAVAAESGQLLRIDAGGTISVIGTGFGTPMALEFGPDGALYVSDLSAEVIYRITRDVSATINIKPYSINPYGRGVVTIAIFGSDEFDVTEIDVTSLRFGPNEASCAHDLTDTFDYNEHLEDMNLDGYMDLMTHYRVQETGIACGDTEATLSGLTLSGRFIEGTDFIRTVGCTSSRPINRRQLQRIQLGDRERPSGPVKPKKVE